MSIITLSRTAQCWVATFTGPLAQEVIDVMGSNVIPTGFTARASAGEVAAFMRFQWPGYVITVAAQGVNQ